MTKKKSVDQSIAEFVKKDKNLGGRPKKIDDAILGKLREAFLIGCTDAEACFYANIDPTTMYDFQKVNEWFSQWKEALKDNPTIKARQTVFSSLGVSKDAQWYLERKKKSEFSPRTEHTDGEGKPIVVGFNYVAPEKPNEQNNNSHT